MSRHFVLFALTASLGCPSPPDDEEPSPDPPIVYGPAVARFLVNEHPERDDSAFVEVDALDGGKARYGDPFTLVVEGLEPGTEIVVEGALMHLASRATFTVPDDGKVDLARDLPLVGSSWDVVDGEAIVWSMLPSGPPPLGLDLTVTARVLQDDEEVAQAVLRRRYTDEGLVVEPVASGRTRGLLALPPGDGPFPALLTFGGSEGGTSTGEFDATFYASLGYAVLGVGYFGATGLPAQLEEVPLEILEEDLAFLEADPRVDAERIAVKGGSRGGELALLVAAHFPIVRATIATVPSGLVWGAVSSSSAAWTLDGEPLPHVPEGSGRPDVTVDDDGVQHVSFRPMFLQDMADASAEELAAATIHVEDAAGPILMLAAEDDQLWPSCPMAEVALARLQDAAREGDELICFPDAGHAMHLVGWSTMDSVELDLGPSRGYRVLGGTPAGNARAARQADTAIRRFLAERL